MRLKEIEIAGFKSFAKKAALSFDTPVTAVVGPNGSGKSNVVEAFRFVLGEQSMKSMRGKTGADLIFRGSNSIGKLSRGSVSVTFDNSDHVFGFQTADGKSPITFDTVTFTREIFADGTSSYLLNGTELRLKQMVELLGSVNIGSSGHHIISQGEADNILRVNPRDRREMLEDALGLKIYHFRIKESESKLEKTYETLKDVQSLRRELAPHLKFLQKQVEKIEKARALRNELQDALLHYLANERAQLEHEERRLDDATSLIARTRKELETRLADLPDGKIASEDSIQEIAHARKHLESLLEKRRGLEQQIGRLEGRVEAHRSLLAQSKQVTVSEEAVSFAPSEYRQLLSDIDLFLGAVRSADSVAAVQDALAKLEPIIRALHARQATDHQSTGGTPLGSQSARELSDFATELESLERDLKALITEETSVRASLTALEHAREQRLRSSEQQTHERYEVLAAIKDCDSELQILAVTRSAFVQRKELFDGELKEAAFMFGPSFLHALRDATQETTQETTQENQILGADLHDLKRGIDRLKIRLDEHSGVGDDVAKEYESTVERDQFLSREVTDIEGSIRNLETLIVDLKRVLDERFTDGVKVINDRFGEFFRTMFGGGNAFLSITMEKKRPRKGKRSDEELEDMDEDDLAASESDGEDGVIERGIEVHVSLPTKKVKELTMLSGGERSLVSIALLFAISQVNPPPFLVLDETDAALDEANSRRYGDMIEILAEYSQLIVVTHNRETMSRASVLYGVTLGNDGASKLLSIKFDEAVKVAK